MSCNEESCFPISYFPCFPFGSASDSFQSNRAQVPTFSVSFIGHDAPTGSSAAHHEGPSIVVLLFYACGRYRPDTVPRGNDIKVKTCEVTSEFFLFVPDSSWNVSLSCNLEGLITNYVFKLRQLSTISASEDSCSKGSCVVLSKFSVRTFMKVVVLSTAETEIPFEVWSRSGSDGKVGPVFAPTMFLKRRPMELPVPSKT